MKYKMFIKIRAVFLNVYLVVLTINSHAQFVSVPTTVHTPRGNVTVWTPQHMHTYNNFGNQNRKHTFSIVLMNDSIIEAKTRINIDDSIHTLEWGKKDQITIIKPSETKEIYRTEGNKIITGIPADSCWLFLVDDGKIKTYSITSETDYPIIAYIQNSTGGPVLPLTKENLVGMITDNEKAMKFANKEKLLKAIEKYNKE